jgi:hypothetical protein
MEYKIVKATNVAKKAMRKANKESACSLKVRAQKKYAMKQYRKMVETKKKSSNKLDQDFSKYLEWAILATIGLAVLSVSQPQVGILAIIFSILIVAAIMDTKIRNMNEKSKKESDERMEKILRLVHNEKKYSAIEVSAARESIREIEATAKKEKTHMNLVSASQMSEVTEFPYKSVQ